MGGDVSICIGIAGKKRVVIARRSTREDFLKFAPAPPENVESFRAPFYWELELKEVIAR